MDIKKEIENNIILWFAATIIASFLSGLAVYEGIIRIAKLEVVTQGEIKLLREEKKKYEELKNNYAVLNSRKKEQVEKGLKIYQRENIK